MPADGCGDGFPAMLGKYVRTYTCSPYVYNAINVYNNVVYITTTTKKLGCTKSQG